MAKCGNVAPRMDVLNSHEMWWDLDGCCTERSNDGPATRRPDMDFGTPQGDTLFAPWVQRAALKGAKRRGRKR